eukprot:5572753-Heterocapsa_arctica.AAC.1
MTSFKNLSDDWIGDESAEVANIPWCPPQIVPDLIQPHSSQVDSHPFSLEPVQPVTPLGQIGTTAIIPTLSWDDDKTTDQLNQAEPPPQASPRVNLDGE